MHYAAGIQGHTAMMTHNVMQEDYHPDLEVGERSSAGTLALKQ